ncbi:MAG: YggS family pyridoxal phosphate-dependent enzyme [Eubacteriales bacterium]
MIIEKNLTRIISTLPEQVHLVAVTKHRSIEEIQRVVNYGIQDLGENKVQELLNKYPKIKGDVRWHFIGHLQRNKVKVIIDKVHLIHSVDSIRLAEEVQLQSLKIQKKTSVLIQVNISKEESKYGIDETQINNFIAEVSRFKNIVVQGLMTMAPYTENIEETRHIFNELYKIYDKIKANQSQYSNVFMHILSMGMTNDYSVAVAEGSTMVRIGRGIFQ